VNDLPAGWVWTDLAHVCSSITDGDHQAPPQVPLGVPFLVIGNVRNNVVDFTGCRHVPPEYFESLNPIRRPTKDDVLYTLVGSYGIAVLVEDSKPFCVQRHIGIIRPSPKISARFLALVLSSRAVFDQASKFATGTAQLTVPLAGLRRIRIPLPPRPEQERIVEAIEVQFSRLDFGIAALERMRQNLMRMRTAVLDAAVNTLSTPTVPARDLFRWASGKRMPSSGGDGPFPAFGGNGITGRCNEALTSSDTLVIGRVGAQCGNVYLTDGPAWVTDNAIYVSDSRQSVSLQFAALVFQAAHLRERAGGTGQPFVNQTILNDVKFPVVTLEKQSEIVRYQKYHDAGISALLEYTERVGRRSKRLRSAILAAAFAGKLAPQNITDEPATVLLERIKAEQASSNSRNRKNPYKPRAKVHV
jgi:hypothetical protein